MKTVITVLTVLTTGFLASADALHPLIANHAKTIGAVAEYALHKANYANADFDTLVGVSSVQDTVRKIRVITYTFSGANCARNLEMYTKLDGSAVLSHKVVGCGQ